MKRIRHYCEKCKKKKEESKMFKAKLPLTEKIIWVCGTCWRENNAHYLIAIR